jgi:hypothetical protein
MHDQPILHEELEKIALDVLSRVRPVLEIIDFEVKKFFRNTSEVQYQLTYIQGMKEKYTEQLTLLLNLERAFLIRLVGVVP